MYFKVIEATMKPNSTIEGLIRYYNSLHMTKEQLEFAVEMFNTLNPTARPPKPFQKVEMPVLIEYLKLENTTP